MTETYAYPSTLVLPFISALLQRTLHCPTAAAHQQALHGFLDDLTPWLRQGRPADAAGAAVHAV
jgi:hypothetical protein